MAPDLLTPPHPPVSRFISRLRGAFVLLLGLYEGRTETTQNKERRQKETEQAF